MKINRKVYKFKSHHYLKFSNNRTLKNDALLTLDIVSHLAKCLIVSLTQSIEFQNDFNQKYTLQNSTQNAFHHFSDKL